MTVEVAERFSIAHLVDQLGATLDACQMSLDSIGGTRPDNPGVAAMPESLLGDLDRCLGTARDLSLRIAAMVDMVGRIL